MFGLRIYFHLRPVRRRSSEAGFALLITMTLLGFVTVLLVSLGMYLRVETAVTGNTQKLAQARQNALLALEVALGQLQKHAGPDRRVTATGDSNGGANAHLTGVWDSTTPGAQPLTWLVSGSEAPASASLAPWILVGAQTAGTDAAAQVAAPFVDIVSVGMPGREAAVTIGRYAWWIGDQGVKAPVGLTDQTLVVATAPYDSSELRSRLRQQIPLGAGAAEFEPRDATNRAMAANLLAGNQLGFLKNLAGESLGAAEVRRNYHAWSVDHAAVLANTRDGGLRADLSVRPDLLGAAFAKWANYEPAAGGYMEAPETPAPSSAGRPVFSPAYPAAPREAQRRRYRLCEPVVDRGIVAGVAPVLAVCLLNFDSRTVGGAAGLANIETRLRWTVALWNPYSSALVPENLRLEISGLPPSLEFCADAAGPTLASVPLTSAQMFGPVLRLALPWDASRTNLRDKWDASSWLPGRVYYWTSLANTAEPAGGNLGYFYWKTLIGTPSHVITRTSSASVIGSTSGGWRVPQKTRLTCRLFREGASEPLATFDSPEFPAFFATDRVAEPKASNGTYEFSFIFRLDQNRAAADSEWLTSEGRDPRGPRLPPEAYRGGSQGLEPQNYPDVPALANEDLLLERSMSDSGRSYNEDVPVFELPRNPLLSIGALQHLPLLGRRPFAIGSAAGKTGGWNDVFDRYFFSGVTAATVPPDFLKGEPLPNPLLTPLRYRSDGARVTAAAWRTEATAYASRELLQRGAFNLNSTEPVAWRAFLRSARMEAGATIRYVDATEAEGTAGDAAPISPRAGDGKATFFRFPQSVGEVLKADEGKAGGAPDTFNPTPSTVAGTHLFRRGMRMLTDVQLDELVAALVELVRNRHREAGPFRSVSEFLDAGILQAAIDRTSINDDPETVSGKREFSSQFLTQADIMTVLAPALFARSDTFVVRAYGEVLNPLSGAVEGRAWCEGTVQRTPEYFDPTDRAETPPDNLSALNRIYGRRFKLISFRWLTRSDI